MDKYFETTPSKFLNYLQTGAQFAQNKSTLPVLSFGLFTRSVRGTLAIASTNLEAGVVVDTDIPLLGRGIAVPVKTLIELVRGMTAPIKFEIDDRLSVLVMKSGGSKTELKCLPADEFPPMAYSSVLGGPKPASLTIDYDGSKLADAIHFVGSSASQDNARPVLEALYLENGAFTCADGFRLAHFETVLEETNPKTLINAALLTSVAKAFPGGSVTVSVYDGLTVFRCGMIEYLFTKIEGAFPDYTQIYPTQEANTISVPKGELARVLRTAKVMAPATRIVVLQIEAESLTIKAQNEETGFFSEQMPSSNVLPKGEFEFALNVDFFSDAVSKYPESLLTLHASAATSPIVLKSDHPDYVKAYHVIMPMHLGQ